MQLRAKPQKLNAAGEELLALSWDLRRTREELDVIERWLLRQKGLEECAQAIRRQSEELSLTTAGLVRMTSSLNEVARLYSLTESKNTQLVEDLGYRGGSYRENLRPGTSGKIRKRLDQLFRTE